MRICILANAQAVHTQRWAAALAARGHTVMVASIRSAEIHGAEVVTVRWGPANSPRSAWTLLSYLKLLVKIRGIVRRFGADVVNPHYCITHGVIAAAAGLRPRVVNVWGSDVAGGTRVPWLRRVLVRFSVEDADAVVSTSETMLDETRRLLRRAPTSHVVPFGVDTERFHPAETVADASGPLIVGFVKSFEDRYAPDDFLHAAGMALERGVDARFVMAGRGRRAAACVALAARLGIAHRVAFPGFIPHDALPELIRSLDMLVNCSVQESFGVVLCEASASGVPVIATDVGGVREVVVDGLTGRLVPKRDPRALADAIQAFAHDRGLRLRMGAAGRHRVRERFEWSDCVEWFERALQSRR